MKQRTVVTMVLSAVLACAARGQGTGYWHTSGNQILDANNQVVRIAGVNWYGFETTDEVVHGLWAQDYRSILNAVKANGYNTVRLPFSNQMVESPIVPSNVSYNNSGGAINTDLKGLNSLQIMDKIIAYAGQIGLRVILDNHRSEAGNSAEANGLWYTSAYPKDAWINDWKALASRYVGNTTVIGADLRNEPHNATNGGACWGCGSGNDWRLAAQEAGNDVLSVNSNWLIFVEGTDCFNGDCDWWGGNLQGAKSYPVTLNVPNRLVYSAHDYGPHEYQQSWFNGSTTPASLQAVWTKNWAYLSQNGTAPVWLGEFGTTNNSSDVQNTAAGSQGQWFQALVSFLRDNPAIDWTYWALNGEDSYGLLDNNYGSVPANSQKQQLLASIQAPLSGGGGTPSCQSAPAVPAGVTASAVSSSQINVSWNPVTAPAGCSVAYNVYESETAGFTPSGSNQVANGLSSPGYSAAGLAAGTTYYFVVAAVDAAGQSGYSSPASTRTQANTGNSVVPPSNLSAVAVSSSQINLTWTASPTSGVSYNVYRSQSSGFIPSSNTRIATGINGTSYENSGLTAASTYYFVVTAVNANGESGASNGATATTQGAATGAACHVTYMVNTQWNNGFNTSITIQNTGSTAINHWALTWNWSGNQIITQTWNANLQSGGPQVTLTNADWNGSIAPGGSVSGIGFNASYNGSNSNPAAFYLNGTRCQ